MSDKIFYRGDKAIYKQAKIAAAIADVKIGKWIDDAIREKLAKDSLV